MRNSVSLLTVSLVALASVPYAAQAQQMPCIICPHVAKTVAISILHPPSVGLTVKRVAFGQPSGTCASELVDTVLKPEFSKNQVDVIDRDNLDQILKEHNFNQSGFVDSQNAAKLGQILGPSALIIVKVYDCRTTNQPLVDTSQRNLNNTIHTFYISKTQASLKGSIDLVDLTTGRTLGARQFESHPEKQNTSDAGQPEYPADFELKSIAMQEAGAQVTRVFFPWIERKAYTFYDDKDCGLKDVYEALHRGDVGGALTLATNSKEQCSSGHRKNKTAVRAVYDLAMCYFARGNVDKANYDKAKELFTEAMQEKGAEAAAQAAADCDRAKQEAEQLKTYQDRLALIPAPGAVAPPSPATPKKEQQAAASDPPKMVAPVPEKTSGDVKPSPEDRLKRLNDLLKKGLITRVEYDKKKAEVLKDF